MQYPLPNDTAQLLGSHSSRISNLGLALDKYLKVYEASDTDDKNKPIKQADIWKHPPQIRLRKWASEHAQIKTEMQKIVKAASERHQVILTAVNARHFIAAPDYHVVVGFGAEHVLETNLCLHRIYGFPIIPGSAVKGLARAFAFWEIAEALKVPALDFDKLDALKKEKLGSPLQTLDKLLCEGDDKKRKALIENLQKLVEQLQKESICEKVEAIQTLDLERWNPLAANFYAVFGTQANRGSVTFFDAYPATTPKLEPDILNPHFGEYYQPKKDHQGNKIFTPPSDTSKPSPTYFLTVAAGQEFRFAVAGHLADKAEAWLKQGLATLGIGGKTSSGYGFFPDKDKTFVDDWMKPVGEMLPHHFADQVPKKAQELLAATMDDKYKKQIAQKLVDEIEKRGRTSKSTDKPWYQELLSLTETKE